MHQNPSWLISLLLLLYSAVPLRAQTGGDAEALEAAEAGNTYLSSRTAALDKYLSRSAALQQRLLKKLQKRENKFLKKLAAKDSALYRQYLASRTITYDSIASLGSDTAYLRTLGRQGNTTIDSLRRIGSLVTAQQAVAGGLAGKLSSTGLDIPYADKLSALQQQLNWQQQAENLAQSRTQLLESFSRRANIPGLGKVQQDLYYAKEKIKNWKQLADEPDEAEARALEYLQGTEGFDKYLSSGNSTGAFGGLGNNATEADLQRLGYQTKSQTSAMLQQQLGGNLHAVQQQMAAQVQQYAAQLGGIGNKISQGKEAVAKGKQALAAARSTMAEAKEQAKNLKTMEKASFTPNPERGKPFWQRIEVQYNFQTSRAATDGSRPAMADVGASLGFRHTPALSYGLGLALSAGLGQSWQDLHLSYEGMTARVYADYKIVYGFSLQSGYERSFRPANRSYLTGNDKASGTDNIFSEAFGGQQQAAYAGIMKRYRIGSKWSGTFLAGYNFLWRQEGLRTPWLLRFGWGKQPYHF